MKLVDVKHLPHKAFGIMFKPSVRMCLFEFFFFENVVNFGFLTLYSGMKLIIVNLIEVKNRFCTLDTAPSSVIFH